MQVEGEDGECGECPWHDGMAGEGGEGRKGGMEGMGSCVCVWRGRVRRGGGTKCGGDGGGIEGGWETVCVFVCEEGEVGMTSVCLCVYVRLCVRVYVCVCELLPCKRAQAVAIEHTKRTRQKKNRREEKQNINEELGHSLNGRKKEKKGASAQPISQGAEEPCLLC